MVMTVTFDLEKLTDRMDLIKKSQIPFAMANTMNQLSKQIAIKELRAYMDKTFDGGATGFTQRASLYKAANKNDLKALIYLKGDRPYLKTLKDGGTVKPLKTNRALLQPITKHTKTHINKFGNLPRNKVRSLTSKKKKYFLGRPGNKSSNTVGLYEYPKNKGDKFKLLIKYDQPSRRQRKIFRPTELAYSYVQKNFVKEFNRQFRKAIRTAK
jgi:hypothetical protein